MVVGPDRQRRHVDDRILPDLGIDEAAEGEGEGALEQAGLRERLAAMHRGLEPGDGGAPRRLRGQGHCRESLLVDLAGADRAGK